MASKGAWTIAQKMSMRFAVSARKEHMEHLAELIDAELAELLPFLRHEEGCKSQSYCYEHCQMEQTREPCDCGLDAILAKWEKSLPR